MKHAFIGLALGLSLSLAAPAQAQSVGFSGIGESAKTQNAKAAVARAKIPTYATQSRNAKRGRPFSERAAAESALAWGSSKWTKRHAAPVASGDVRAMLRVIVSDGQPFAVLGKIKQPAFQRKQQPQALLATFTPAVKEMTGCSPQSNLYGYGPNPAVAIRMAIPLDC